MGPKELPEGVGDTARRHRGKTVRLRKANLWGGGMISKQNGGRENRPDPISWLTTKLGGTSVCGHPKQFQVCDDSSYLSKTSHQAEIKPFVGSGRMVMHFVKGFHMSLIGSSCVVYLGLPWSTWIYLKVYVYFPMSQPSMFGNSWGIYNPIW